MDDREGHAGPRRPVIRAIVEETVTPGAGAVFSCEQRDPIRTAERASLTAVRNEAGTQGSSS